MSPAVRAALAALENATSPTTVGPFAGQLDLTRYRGGSGR